jgi:hypothetical protein
VDIYISAKLKPNRYWTKRKRYWTKMKILDREINDVDDDYDRVIIQILHKLVKNTPPAPAGFS